MARAKQDINPITTSYEFGGPVGAFFITLILPVVVFFLHFSSSKEFSLTLGNVGKLSDHIQKKFSHIGEYFSIYSIGIIFAWFALNAVMERVIFSFREKGVVLRNGDQLTYKISAHLQFWLILFFLLNMNLDIDSSFTVRNFGKAFDLSFLYDRYLELAVGSLLFSLSLSVFLYAKSFAPGAILATGGNSGNAIYDFFIGRELNPRLFSDFDLKEFCELRPGLIGWTILNLGCMMKQATTLGYITPDMFLVNVFQSMYVWDALYHEKAILTTMDITSDGFGFMLAFGDLTWVPFTYSLQARYLVDIPSDSRVGFPVLILASFLHLLGYFVFRSSNSEKDAFRTNPDAESVQHLRYLKTSSGRKLLISGWWGKARKINYTGDWLMGFSWSLLTGFSTPVTYFYPIYFFILLIHRAMRDDHACHLKYGPDWPKYKSLVPYVFVPGVI